MSSYVPHPDGQQAPVDPYAQQVPQQPYGYAPPPTAPQRNTLVFVCSILLIIGGAIGIIAMLGTIGLLAAASVSGTSGLLTLLIIVGIVGAIYELVVGIMGVKGASTPSKAGQLLNLGYGLVAIQLIALIIAIPAGGFSYSSVIGFLLPVLFVVGAMQMKKQVA